MVHSKVEIKIKRMSLFAFICVLLCVTLLSTSVEGAAIRAARQQPNDIEALKSMARSISSKIKHIIILMEENRSFDHMFGFYGKGTNGLTGKEYNLVNTSDPSSQRIYVDNKAPFLNQCDPSHDATSTTYKIYGNQSMALACNFTCENMGGFVEREGQVSASENYCNVMESLDNTNMLPVITALADEFVLMDRFFCSMPGPTWPNRLFHLSATSAGLTETYSWYQGHPGSLFPQKTIFDQVADVGGEWRVYYNDTPWEMIIETIAHHPENLASMTQFFEDCENGNLPDYAFINPRSGVNLTERVGSNDQHPDHDVRAGEQFYKDIYEALRASPQWNETLFILTYDEHGGFHDHVLPPLNVPDPEDGIETYPDPGFKFDRLGIRIPTLLISPWVPKGLVVGRAPEAQRPFPDSEYDLTSIMASARKILGKLEGTPALTNRDAWASTFEHVLDILPEIRTDCPMHLPTPQAPSQWAIAAEAQQPINDLQADIIHTHHLLAHPHEEGRRPRHIQQQSQVGDYLKETFAIHKERTLRWKAGKGALPAHVAQREGIVDDISNLTMRITPLTVAVFLNTWHVSVSDQVPYNTIRGDNGDTQSLCISAPKLAVGAPIGINLCYPSSDPAKNRDPSQWWIMGNDATIRPYKAQNLCVTNDYFQLNDPTTNRVYLDTCVDDVRQHYAYHGPAPGEPDDIGVLYYGDCTTVISAVAN